MKIKAISLWEPWASLMATGAKPTETRSWSTNYRGPLLICAAKKWGDPSQLRALADPRFQGGLAPLNGFRLNMNADRGYNVTEEHMQLGMAVAIVELTDCQATQFLSRIYYHAEKVFGDYRPGRFAWLTTKVRAITPFPVKGQQRLWEVELPEGLDVEKGHPLDESERVGGETAVQNEGNVAG